MQKTMKKVLSIFAVFVVLLGSLLMPVHAEGDSIELNKDSIKTEFNIRGFLDSKDKVYAIRLVDTKYIGDEVLCYETKQWVLDAVNDSDKGAKRDPIFGNKGGYVDIQLDDLNKIYEAANKKYTEETAVEHEFYDLGEVGHSLECTGQLPTALYLIKVVPHNTKAMYGPSLLGVNLNESGDLDLRQQYQNRQGESLAVKTIDPKIHKRVIVSGELGKENAKLSSCFSPIIKSGDRYTFVIDNIYIPRFTKEELEDPDFLFRLDDRHEDGVYWNESSPAVKCFTHYTSSVPTDGSAKEHVLRGITNDLTEENIKELDNQYKQGKLTHDYYLNADKGVTVYFGKDFLKENAGKFITVAYDTIYKKSNYYVSANQLDGNRNNATVTIITGKDKDPEIKEGHATGYVYELPFLKYDLERYKRDNKFEDTELEGAKFKVYETIDCNEPAYNKDDGMESVSGKDGIVKLKGLTFNFVDQEEDLDKFDPSLDKGLGITYFRETEAPKAQYDKDGSDYQLNPTVYKVMLNGWEDDDQNLKYRLRLYNTNDLSKPILELDENSQLDGKNVLWYFANSVKPFLPSTGSKTMMILTVVGIVLITGVVVVSRKKKHQNSTN